VPQQTLNRWVQAAAVAKTYSPWVDLIPYSATSLSIIHRAPESDWPDLVQRMRAEKWTKGQTLRHVEAITSRQIKDPHWHCGDWRKYIDTLKDDSVSLLLIDPPYGIDDQAAELHACLQALFPKLKSDADLLCFIGSGRDWRYECAVRKALVACGYQLHAMHVWLRGEDPTEPDDPTDLINVCECIIHAGKGSPRLLLLPDDGDGYLFEVPRIDDPIHPKEKPVALLKWLIEAATVEGDLVADPFGGVASTLIAAKQSKRKYWGCELDEEYYRAGAARQEKEI
jgi:hypothetical protein